MAAELRAEPGAAGIGPITDGEGAGAGTSVDWTSGGGALVTGRGALVTGRGALVTGGGALATGMGVWHALRMAAAALQAKANNHNLRGSASRFLCLMMVLSLLFHRGIDSRFLTILPKKLVLKLP